MPEITIDADICKKDGLCAMACTRAVFQQKETNSVPEIDGRDRCFVCGQCVSICSHNAISHSDFPEGTTLIRPEYIPTYDHVLELLRSRRSKRLWKEKAIEKFVIEKILDAARFGPSAHNEQTTEFVVVQDKNKIQEIATLTSKGLEKLVHPLRNPFGRTMMRFAIGRRSAEYVAHLAPELEHLITLFNNGTDWILRKPPALLFFCADSAGGNFANVNANLALQNAALAAETLGLGCYYTGFVVIVGNRDNSIAKSISLPNTHKIYGALAMGHPLLQFRKWPERKPAKVTWI